MPSDLVFYLYTCVFFILLCLADRTFKATFSPHRCHRPPPPPAAAARRTSASPNTPRRPAKAARRKAWRGLGRSGQAAQDALG
jgi:hypothetical protein